MKRLLLILVALALLPATACSLRQKPTGQDYYAQGQLDFAQKEYKAAIENYQHVIDQFPFSPYAEDAEMKIGLAYYQQKDYAEAIGALDDFQRMHPTSQNLELVTYYIGMSYYDQMGREDQDQTKTEQALKRFQELEQRFPEGSFAELAHEKFAVCREMLARNQMVVGNYYYKRANFRAAESRFAELMQKYPDTPVAPDALFELGISLEKEGKRYSAAQAFTAVAGRDWIRRKSRRLARRQDCRAPTRGPATRRPRLVGAGARTSTDDIRIRWTAYARWSREVEWHRIFASLEAARHDARGRRTSRGAASADREYCRRGRGTGARDDGA